MNLAGKEHIIAHTRFFCSPVPGMGRMNPGFPMIPGGQP